MLGRKYRVESLLSERSAKKRWAEGSTRFPVLGLLCRVHIIFQAKDARQISTPCHETSASEAVRGEGNSSCPNLEPKIRSSGLICPNLRPIYHFCVPSGKLGQICTNFEVKQRKLAPIVGIDHSESGETALHLTSFPKTL